MTRKPKSAERLKGERGFSMLEMVFVAGLAMVIGAIAAPMMGNSIGNFRLTGDARGLKNAVSLARMQAAANFAQARVHVDLSTSSYTIETCQQTGATPAWVTQGGSRYLSSSSENFSFSPVSTAPPSTQAPIAQAPQCLAAAAGGCNAGQAIGNTACILFNSRGIPVDSTGAPTAAYALYITDGSAVFGTTVSATSVIRLWRTYPTATPAWVQQ